MVTVRRVAFLRNLQHVKAEFRLHVGEFAVLISHAVAVFLAQPRIQNGHCAVRADAMTVVVRRVMRERTKRKGVLCQVLRVVQQRPHEIAAANIMRQVAEKWAAVRVVAHILNNGAAVRIGLRPAQVLLRSLRILCQKQGLDVAVPGRVNDRFMGKHGIGLRGFGPQ